MNVSWMLLPAGSMPPVAVWVVEALTESKRVTDKLLSLALVYHLLLFGFALQLQTQTHTQTHFTPAIMCLIHTI